MKLFYISFNASDIEPIIYTVCQKHKYEHDFVLPLPYQVYVARIRGFTGGNIPAPQCR
jgi:hypothetical protein